VWWVSDTFGPYDVAKNWPADISTVPEMSSDLERQGSTLRIRIVFPAFRGELPNIKSADQVAA